MREPHIIYGYRSRLNGKWKVGCTLQDRAKRRHDEHLSGKSGCQQEREGNEETFRCQRNLDFTYAPSID